VPCEAALFAYFRILSIDSDTMKILVFILAVTCLLACKKDSGDMQKPVIVINTPTANQQFPAFSSVTISGTVADENLIHQVHVEVTNKNNSTSVMHIVENVGAKSYNINQVFTAQSGITYKIHIEAQDQVGNIEVVEMEVKGI
jgi:hypothetical protein